MSVGEKIKELRKRKGLSQSELASELNVTPQAISKWETGLSAPDISLLPEIAAYFGVMIDDLFQYSKEKEIEKICHMIENQRWLSNEEFLRAEGFLLKEIGQDANNHLVLSALADLYHFMSKCQNKKAVQYAKAALKLKPNDKFDIGIINNAMRGGLMDWNINNHHELIDIYIEILKENPENKRVYFYLMDNLITDGRCTEAVQVLKQSRAVLMDVLLDYYEIAIDEKKEGFLRVKDRYHHLAQKYQSEWRILISVADAFASNEHYKEAIDYYTQAFETMEKPRYTDFLESIAQLYVHLNEKEKAIEAYLQEIELLKNEWNITSGESVDRIIDQIKKLKQGNPASVLFLLS